MSSPVVLRIHIDGVAGVDILHDLSDVGLGSLDDEMVMIVHEDIRMQKIPIPLFCPSQDVQESSSVGILEKYFSPEISSGCNMIERPRECYA